MKAQPKALRILLPTQMAETYGYFTLQSILIFYLTKQLSFSDADAYAFSGQFIALAWLSPMVGGWIADQFLGARVAILLGSFLLCIGYAILALGQHTLLTGLSLVIVGGGLFKPNISSFMGEFYASGDSRRAAGFTLIYVAINLASLLAIAGVGYIQQYIGWGACFGAASFALFLGITIFSSGFRYFNDKGLPATIQSNSLWIFLNRQFLKIILGLCIALILVYISMRTIDLGNYSLAIFGLLFVFYLLSISRKLVVSDRYKLLGLMILFIIAIFYKAMFFENYLVINVLTDRLIDRRIYGHEIPALVFLSFGSLFTLILGPLFAYVWQSNRIKLSIPIKFALSLLLVSICMAMLATWLKFETQLVQITVIILYRFLFTVSELLILPIGLAAVTEYAPKNYRGLMMGAWYFTAAVGGKLAGLLASYADVPTQITNITNIKMIYQSALQKFSMFSFTFFILCLMLTPIINKLLNKGHSVHQV